MAKKHHNGAWFNKNAEVSCAQVESVAVQPLTDDELSAFLHTLLPPESQTDKFYRRLAKRTIPAAERTSTSKNERI